MLRMAGTALVAALLALNAPSLPAPQAPPADFYVAPDGSDTNPGTAEKPFASLARAQRAVRRILRDGLRSDVLVLVRGGLHALTEPLVFGPQDSGTQAFSVTYAACPGETVVVSGGRAIGGWQRGEDGLWTARVAGVREGEWYFRQLYVNGRRATRARTPNLTDDAPFWQLAGAALSDDLREFSLTFAPDQVREWANLGDVEIVVPGEWAIFRKRLVSVDPTASTALLEGPHVSPQVHQWNRPHAGRWFHLENAREFLDQPGEWYLDRASGVLTYRPGEGKDMGRAQVVAPVLTRLVEVRGSADRPVSNLHFRGLRFEHATWELPEGGYRGVQACHFTDYDRESGETRWAQIEPAILFEFARGCSLTDGEVAHLGGSGLFLSRGCEGNRMEGNCMWDIAGNGIMVGGPDDPTLVPRDNVVTNNHVHDCGAEFYGAVGVSVGFAQGTQVSHNLVHHLPYTGISVGWRWDDSPTACERNIVEYNHIHHVMGRLADGGGIYTLGLQPGTVLRGNLIHDVVRSPFAQGAPNNGIFFDQGSKGFLVAEQVIYSTTGQPIRFNQCAADWHTWEGNQFGVPRAAEGKVGPGLLCDGSGSAVDAPGSEALDPKHLTVEAWVRLSEYPDGADRRRWLVNKNDDEWTEGHYALVIDADKVGAYLNIGGGQQNSHGAFSEEGLVELDRWQHLAMTYDGADLRVYCDGEEVAREAVGKERTPGNTPVALGKRQDAYNFFRGVLDEVRVYARALSAEEVRANYEAERDTGRAAAEQGVVGYWGFDELSAAHEAVKSLAARAGLEPPYRGRLMDEE